MIVAAGFPSGDCHVRIDWMVVDELHAVLDRFKVSPRKEEVK